MGETLQDFKQGSKVRDVFQGAWGFLSLHWSKLTSGNGQPERIVSQAGEGDTPA